MKLNKATFLVFLLAAHASFSFAQEANLRAGGESARSLLSDSDEMLESMEPEMASEEMPGFKGEDDEGDEVGENYMKDFEDMEEVDLEDLMEDSEGENGDRRELQSKTYTIAPDNVYYMSVTTGSPGLTYSNRSSKRTTDQWYFESAKEGGYYLHSKYWGQQYCVDNNFNSNVPYMHRCTGGKNQRFKLYKSSKGSSRYYICSNYNGKCIDFETNHTSFAIFSMKRYDGSYDQRFTIVRG